MQKQSELTVTLSVEEVEQLIKDHLKAKGMIVDKITCNSILTIEQRKPSLMPSPFPAYNHSIKDFVCTLSSNQQDNMAINPLDEGHVRPLEESTPPQI